MLAWLTLGIIPLVVAEGLWIGHLLRFCRDTEVLTPWERLHRAKWRFGLTICGYMTVLALCTSLAGSYGLALLDVSLAAAAATVTVRERMHDQEFIVVLIHERSRELIERADL